VDPSNTVNDLFDNINSPIATLGLFENTLQSNDNFEDIIENTLQSNDMFEDIIESTLPSNENFQDIENTLQSNDMLERIFKPMFQSNTTHDYDPTLFPGPRISDHNADDPPTLAIFQPRLPDSSSANTTQPPSNHVLTLLPPYPPPLHSVTSVDSIPLVPWSTGTCLGDMEDDGAWVFEWEEWFGETVSAVEW
jgi:hypothetical protein